MVITHATYTTLVLTVLFCFPIIYKLIKAYMTGERSYIRRISGLEAVEESVGRATEMGKPIFFTTGLGGLRQMETIAGLAVLRQLASLAGKYGIRVIMTTVDFLIQPIAREIIREGYVEAGFPDKFSPDDVMYLTGGQFAYAAGSVGVMHREKVAACFYFGAFMAEALVLSEGGSQVGAMQVAGTADMSQIPFFITTCDYVIMGEELFAAGAYMSQEPTMLACLAAQDLGKLLITFICIIGTLSATIATYLGTLNWIKELLLW